VSSVLRIPKPVPIEPFPTKVFDDFYNFKL
jgi:hypothetical protein